jgi:hypothetical protein
MRHFEGLVYGDLEMNDKKPDGYKVSWGSWKDAFETLVHIVFATGVVYAVYSFFR